MLNLPNRKYKIIYVDPPWGYNKKSTLNGNANKHYPLMTIDKIKKIPIHKITEDDCFLFMWTTLPFIKDALDIIEEWGFTYKTLGFSWIKTNKKNDKPFFGIGYYTRSNCELCLLAIKGKPKVKSRSVSSCIISPIEKHSKKPDEVKDRIVELCGNISRIELFAREKTKGWHVWGNEV